MNLYRWTTLSLLASGLCHGLAGAAPKVAPRAQPKPAPVSAPKVNGPSLVDKIIALSNRAREENGVRPVSKLSYLCQAAAGHSQEMMDMKYFSHVSPTPGRERPKTRIELSGGWEKSIAENIYRGSGIPEDEIAEEVVDAWMNSPVHRKNLLNPKFNSMGIGVAKVGEDQWAITQLFALQTVALDSYQANKSGDGYNIKLSGRVIEGGDEGGIFYRDNKLKEWEKRIDANVETGSDGVLSIGQKDSDGQFNVELEFPVGATVATPSRTDIPPFGTSGRKIPAK